jgi:MoxR-like ATPase
MTDKFTSAPQLTREQGTAAVKLLESSVGSVIRGKLPQVRLAISCLLAEGHLLIEDKPGTGKTSLAKAMAASIGGTVRRVQFTPDLLPSDITGVSVFNPVRGEFSFREGPAFTNILIADEINRASPKTQAALLEVMEERQVTYDGVSADRCRRRSWWWPPRTRSTSRAPTRSPRCSSTASR